VFADFILTGWNARYKRHYKKYFLFAYRSRALPRMAGGLPSYPPLLQLEMKGADCSAWKSS